MRRLLTARWLGMHALALLLILVFLGLGWWQLQRGEAGNARSWGYAFQWPAFALFVVYMWIRTIREELHPSRDTEERVAHRSGVEGVDPVPGAPPLGAAYADDDDDDPEVAAELAEYNRYLAELNARTGQGRVAS